ncbi:hypothetical protein LTR35_008262 [Friedmanniomyces endolithicus]|uniref:Uncharacterized protein n=1 Tax=Friedmanniomyces endolithicus TaxID=329885 RepID=A0AAN6J7W7_9PEZI|nr:hypothetical protein LTR35_008262 [Friedmanniomyces endolithicus]KAK0296280.1 hypothetical protein LTS00_005113 [Friedmanniomyces endolithicus]KAK0319665.1 hypothetical protein LTR82_009370 [Friedmanniomyces endolithicus]KAK1004959.1 hypothetical protein LTR54_007280 [Friedmanniomyces endolithicus]
MAALKITKEEGSETDRFYLLESHVHSQRVMTDDNGREYMACPVVSREVSKETWWISPATHEKWMRIGMYQVTHRKVHGRRMNDEVEMFEMEDGKETPGLAQDLLDLGLSVRSHIPEPTKRPSLLLHNTRSKPIPEPNDDDDDEEARKKSHLTHSTALLKSAIATHELTTHRPTPFALLANAGSTDPHTRRPRILIAVLQETQFRDFFQRGYEDFKSNGCSYRVFGTYCRGEVGWVCGDEEFGGYFPGREGDGGGVLECRWWDDTALVEADERARERRVRRREKRERQRRGGEGGLELVRELVGEVGVEVDDGASTEAKKERARAKRKARAARRKAREAASGFTVLVESPSEDGEEDARYSVWSIAAGSKKRAKTARNTASVPRSLADGSPRGEAKGTESSSASSSEEDLDRAELAKELAKLMVGANTQVLVAYPKSDD